MLRKIILLLVTIFLCSAGSVPAAATSPGTSATQGDLARKLVDLFGWSEGLPDKPKDQDYRTILGGERLFPFEAEDVYDSAFDSVTVRNYNLFGQYTGKGWLHGSTVPTAVHFKVFIPIAGKYTLKATIKGDNQLWSIAGRAFKVNAGESFKNMVIGQAFIPPGIVEFNAVIPAGGAIDNLEFSAPSLAPLEPLAGWDFKAKLTGGQLAEVLASLLGKESLLPEDTTVPHKLVSADSVATLPDSLFTTDSQVLGKPLSGKWLRAGQVKAELPLPIVVDSAGVYQVRVRFVGSSLSAGFNGRATKREGKPFLDWVDFGAFRLVRGGNILSLTIPPTAGLDAVEIIRRKSSPADYVTVTGLGKGADEPVTSADLDRILKPLQEKFGERQ